MDNNNEKLILDHVISISSDIGAIKVGLKALNNNLESHVAKDELFHSTITTQVSDVDDYQKKMKWMIAGAVGLASVFISGVVYAIEVYVAMPHK